jgi:hypothetical protein
VVAAEVPGVGDASSLLGGIPETLREELLREFNHIMGNYREGRWEPAELDAGKFCEVVYSIVAGYQSGSYPAQSQKPSNMVSACRALENGPSSLPRSIRIQIPRLLVALYEVRNNRGVGHVGGDVNPNHMDATMVLDCCKWLLAELIRVFHNTMTDVASGAVEALTERAIPLVWEVGGIRRVLAPGLTYKDSVLILLYSSHGGIREGDLREWVEHPSPAAFRRDVLRPLHRHRLIEYRENDATVYLSPTGARKVEEEIPLQLD